MLLRQSVVVASGMGTTLAHDAVLAKYPGGPASCEGIMGCESLMRGFWLGDPNELFRNQ